MWSCRQELESQLGVILFERSSQRVELTEPVRVFIEHAKLAVFHLERVVHLTRVSAKGAEVVVNFGSSPYIDPYIVSTVLSVRLPLFPTMRVHAHSYFSQELTHQASRLGLRAAMHDHKPRRCEREQVEGLPYSHSCPSNFGPSRRSEKCAVHRQPKIRPFNASLWLAFR